MRYPEFGAPNRCQPPEDEDGRVLCRLGLWLPRKELFAPLAPPDGVPKRRHPLELEPALPRAAAPGEADRFRPCDAEPRPPNPPRAAMPACGE